MSAGLGQLRAGLPIVEVGDVTGHTQEASAAAVPPMAAVPDGV